MRVRVLAGFVAVAMLVGVGSASAQMTYAIKGGPNFSTVSGNPAGTGSRIEKSQKIDVSFGGLVTVPISEVVAFQPEFLYQRLGMKYKDLNLAVPAEYKQSIDVVDIPLLLKLGRASEERGFYFLAGPTIDFVTRASRTNPDDSTTDIKDDLKSTFFGLSFGVGMTMKQFLVEYRYSFGLTDMNDKADVDPDNDIKNQSSAIYVGYSFGKK